MSLFSGISSLAFSKGVSLLTLCGVCVKHALGQVNAAVSNKGLSNLSEGLLLQEPEGTVR